MRKRQEFNTECTKVAEKSERFALGNFEAALEPTEKKIGGDGEKGGGDGAGEDYGVVDHRYTTEDEGAEAAGADGGGDGCHANGDDGGGSNAGKDYGTS